MASFATKIVNIYSNFVNEKTNVVGCFFFFGHNIAPCPTKKTFPKVVSSTSQ
jgi:hypothetical protein